MKIAICSDLHLEFGTISLENTENADVLILSGDICVAKDLMNKDNNDILDRFGRSEAWHTFFQECSDRFPHVLYVMGNHEHYHGDFRHSLGDLRSRLNYLRNLHILDKEQIAIKDTIFIGGTLWTDMNNEDPITLMHMKGMMNDFRCVDNSNHMVNFKSYEQIHGVDNREKPIFKQRAARFTPEDAVEDHKQMLSYIRMMVEGKWDQKFVVVGHHAPSKLSTHPRYQKEEIMNGGYSSDLSEFIMDHPQIKLWTHGHTHEEFDYMIGSTRIVCNPRGYDGHENRADEFKLKFVEI
jgi:Icc-related predicted phosphoesterase